MPPLMPNALADLQRRALELVKLADFGPEAVRVNADIVALDPKQEAAWTRLGRCHLEQRNFDEAIVALRAALAINPADSIATNLLNEVRRRRALTPTATERATTGFGVREFAALEALPPDEAKRALGTRIELLFDAINASAIAGEHRRRPAAPRRSRHEAVSRQQLSREQQRSHLRVSPRRPMGAAVQHRLVQPSAAAGELRPHRPRLQRVARGPRSPIAPPVRSGRSPSSSAFNRRSAPSWKRELARWMGANGGFIQYADRPPAVDLLPDQAVEWLLTCRHAAALEWIFVGRWLFLDNADDARILGDRAKLARAADETFRALYPLWLAAYDPPITTT